MINEQIVRAFYRSHLFLKHKVETEGWLYSSNYLREHARCAFGVSFTNSESPAILRILRQRHPDVKPWIGVKPLKVKPLPMLFDKPSKGKHR